MGRGGLWVRWAARDARARWTLVVAIALVVGLGTGIYAGLNATAIWRRESNTASYRRLSAHDLDIRLAEGTTAADGELTLALTTMRDPTRVIASSERLVLPTQVETTAGDGSAVLVPGRIVGMPTSAQVDQIFAKRGRALSSLDTGSDHVAVEYHFAHHYHLSIDSPLRLAGGRDVKQVGHVLSPEYFLVVGRASGLLASEATFAVVFAPLDVAQRLTDHTGTVNDVVVRLAPGTDIDRAVLDIEEAMIAAQPNAAFTTEKLTDSDSYRYMYNDIDSDQKFWTAIAGLILVGAAVASFNLTNRVVESQRRELGIGMALGLRPWQLARRPLLLALQIAVLGTILGIGVGWLVDVAFARLFESLLPLPVWHTSFQTAQFARASIIGLELPLLATLIPVWRAVRVAPIDAIRTSARSARGRTRFRLGHVPLPGRTFDQMPFRNVTRTLRRSLLTALGIGAVITTLVGTLGLVDSMNETINRGEHELRQGQPDRIVADLATPTIDPASLLQTITATPGVADAETGLRVGAQLINGARSLDVLIDTYEPQSRIWKPTVDGVAGSTNGLPGIVLAEKAAADLDLHTGDHVSIRHPHFATSGSSMTTTSFVVLGTTPIPLRSLAYLPITSLTPFGLSTLRNIVTIAPRPGQGEVVQRALFGNPTVASALPVMITIDTARDALQQFLGILRFVGLLILALALLIAFNSTSISVEERAREHATMLAFGLRVRTIIRMLMIESLLIGIAGTAIGIGLGYAFLHWMTQVVIADTLPEIGVPVRLAPMTIVATLALGILTVTLAPLFTSRRIAHLDIPSKLRVVE